MTTRRRLPEGCYDFFVRDCRDGERWGPYDTSAKAGAQLRHLRAYVEPVFRPCFGVERELSETKIGKQLRPSK